MIDIVLRYQALIRELINGSAMVLFLTLTIMIAIFMWDTMVEYTHKKYHEHSIPAARSWTHAPGIPTACALWWIFAAEGYRSGAVWTLYLAGTFENDRGVFFATVGYFTSYGYLLAGIALNGGLLRAIYIFTPPEWKSKVWLYAAVAANAFIASPHILKLGIRIYLDGL